MKNLAIATILAATAFAASAQSNNQETYGQSNPLSGSAKSRADVMTELRAAQASGTIAFGEMSAVSVPQVASGLSRAQVKQEVLNGKRPISGEVSGG